MQGWVEFTAALLVFILSHVIPTRPAIRARAERHFGRRGFSALYGLLSIVLLVWVIAATQRAPYMELWAWSPWQNRTVLGVMLIACWIVALTVGRPNPFSFGGYRNQAFDPDHPGIVAWLRHPLLMALALWAGSHMLANGDLAHVILFGTFAAFALLGQWIIDRRKAREMGIAWQDLRAMTKQARNVPPLFREPHVFVRLALGSATYVLLLLLHPIVIGVNPLV